MYAPTLVKGVLISIAVAVESVGG